MPEKLQTLPFRPMLVLMVSLVTAWLLWSGLYKPLILGLGVVSCLLVFWLVQRMGYFDEELFALRFSLRLMHYWLWLGGQIIRSSIDVTRIVFHPKLPISPRVVDIKVESPHPFDQVVLGNSITLTPGTLSMDVYKGVIKVHSLTEQGAQDLLEGEMNRRVAEVRKK
jgi:multicomponent Na+:H+ antiporter subunit E